MGKIAPVSAKYVIHATIEVTGVVEKPDVIGAIFGQTEGLLGRDLELRELQKGGRIGRIDVFLKNKEGKISGEIIVPSSLDKEETAVVAASLETIERIGPCNARIRVKTIEDVRASKRSYMMGRAKQILHNIMDNVIPDSQEIMEEVQSSVKTAEITLWGPDRLPAGPSVESGSEIIVVEGRADVLNLLKNGFRNVVSLNGTSVPESVAKLCKEKRTVLFLDGDRGGDLILREMKMKTKVDFVARAPDGKEVEELMAKEVHQALRSKVPFSDLKTQRFRQPHADLKKRRVPVRERRERPASVFRIPLNLQKVFKEMLEELIGTRGAFILDTALQVLGKVPVSELENTLYQLDNVFAVVFDGKLTEGIVRVGARKKVKWLVGTEKEYEGRKPRDLMLVSAKDLGV